MNIKINKALSLPIIMSLGVTSAPYISDLEQSFAATAASNKYEYIVVAESLRVRDKSSTIGKQIGSVKKGEKLSVQQELSNGWLEIIFQGKKAYVSGDYVAKKNISQEQPKPEDGVNYDYIVATNILNIRDKASTLGNRIGTYKMGQKLKVEKELSNGWLQITFEGRTAYVSMDYVLKQKVVNDKPVDSGYSYIVTTNGLNVRDKASTLGKRLGKYDKGQKLQAKKELSNGWLQITFEGRDAYVSMDYVNKQKNNTVEEKPASGEYSYIVTTSGLNVREKATTSSKSLGKYDKGQKLQAKKELSNGWLQITFEGRDAYVSMDYVNKQKNNTVEEKPVSGEYRYIVTASGLNVREKATTSSKSLGKYDKGQKLQAKKELSNGWLQIVFEGRDAYVSMDYVEKKKVTATDTTESVDEKRVQDYNYFVDATSLNVRIAPSAKSQVIDRVYKREQLDVKKEHYGWYELEHKGTTAYVSTGYVNKQEK